MQVFDRLFSRRRRFNDLSISIQEHIDERTDELIAEGIAPTEDEHARATGPERLSRR
jgi:putative ABC transport system permease protein